MIILSFRSIDKHSQQINELENRINSSLIDHVNELHRSNVTNRRVTRICIFSSSSSSLRPGGIRIDIGD